MAITLRAVRSLEDVDHNFRVLAQALSNISPDQIAAGAISAGQINGDFMPRAGGGFVGPVTGVSVEMSGAVKGATVTATGAVKGASGEFSGTVKSAKFLVGTVEVALKEAATPDELGLVFQAASVDNIEETAAGAYDSEQVDLIIDSFNALVNALRAAGALETPA